MRAKYDLGLTRKPKVSAESIMRNLKTTIHASSDAEEREQQEEFNRDVIEQLAAHRKKHRSTDTVSHPV